MSGWSERRRERAIRRAAARWFVAHRGDPARTTDEAFAAWHADPRHAAAYARMGAHFAAAGAVARRPPPRAPRGAAATLVFTVAAALLLIGPDQPAIATAVGEQRVIRLPDGSRVVLDTATGIVPAFGTETRRVQLTRGRARFEVAHGDSRPFIVEAGPVVVRAIGTRFDVRHTPVRTEVALLDGRVAVEAPGTERHLAPGEAAVSHAGQVTDAAVDLPAARAWPFGRLVFTGAPLSAVVAEANRYARRPIVLQGPGIASTPVTASFAAADTAAIARTLAASLRLDIEPHPDRLVLAARAEGRTKR